MPEISVIIPVYKTEPYLRQCVDSVLAQAFTDIEVILVDDGSPDGASSLCDAYALADRRVIVIHQNNQGLSAARNAGIEAARGRYIGFVDSDDWIHPEMYALLYEDVKCSSAGIAACGIRKVCDGEEGHLPARDAPLVVETGEQALSAILRCTAPGGHTAWNRLYRRELFQLIRFPPGRLYEDAFVVPILYANVSTACFRDTALYCYRQRSGSIMTRPFDVRSMDKLVAAAAILDHVLAYMPELARDARCFRTVSALRLMWDLLSTGRENFPGEYAEIRRVLHLADVLGNSGLSLRHRALLLLFFLSPALYCKALDTHLK